MQHNISCIVNSGMLISQLLQKLADLDPTVYQETSYETRKMIIIVFFATQSMHYRPEILNFKCSTFIFGKKASWSIPLASEKKSLLLNIASE